MKRVILLVILLSVIPGSAFSQSYVREMAMQFAMNQWNVSVYDGHEFPYPGSDLCNTGDWQNKYVCAEYVARCLQYGGIPAVDKCSAFRLSASLHDWLLQNGYATVVPDIKMMDIGDIIFYKEAGSSKDWSHSAIVIDRNMRNIAQHNKARWDIPWSWGVINAEKIDFVHILDSGESPISLTAPSIERLYTDTSVSVTNDEGSSGECLPVKSEVSTNRSNYTGVMQRDRVPPPDFIYTSTAQSERTASPIKTFLNHLFNKGK